MTFIKSAFDKFKVNKSFYLVFLPVAAFVFVFAFMILMYPQVSADGIKKGLSLCLDTVIPALFPFMFVVTLIYDMGIFNLFSAHASGVAYTLFRLPGVALPIMLMSLIGGFQVGATLIEKAFDDGELTASQAERMLTFCVNPGPAFTVSVIGAGIIGSAEAGLIVYISVMLSTVIIAFFSRFFDNDEVCTYIKKSNADVLCSPSVLSCAINKSVRSTVNICVCILVFCCLNSLVEVLVKNKEIWVYFSMLSEVTNGALTACEYFTLPVIAAVVSFSGFCVHFQILPVILKLKLRYRLFLAVRVISAALSCTSAYVLMQVFPQYNAVFSLGSKPQSATAEVSFPVCVWVMIMCGLFLIGDNYILSKKRLDKSL